MVDVEVGGVVFVDVNLEMAHVVLGFGGEEEVVGGEDLELFAVFLVVLLWERGSVWSYGFRGGRVEESMEEGDIRRTSTKTERDVKRRKKTPSKTSELQQEFVPRSS